MIRREFVQLAHTYKEGRDYLASRYASEKLDGMRCWWDGGVSRGVIKALIPWANCDKDERYKEEQVATGLWSRSGNVIHAPDWWLNQLPVMILDGELYIPNFRQELMKIVKKQDPDQADWTEVKYNVFDTPSFNSLFLDGKIKTAHFKKDIKMYQCTNFIAMTGMLDQFIVDPHIDRPFWKVLNILENKLRGNRIAVALKHIELPGNEEDAKNAMLRMLDTIKNKGGEGLVVRHPSGIYECKRSYNVLKIKPYDDAEGTVIGYTAGVIGKEGRLRGKMGSLRVSFAQDYSGGLILPTACPSDDHINVVEFDLSGFTDDERDFSTTDAQIWCWDNPGKIVPDYVTNEQFPRGSVITFKYRGLSKEGVPQEVRYFRKGD